MTHELTIERGRRGGGVRATAERRVGEGGGGGEEGFSQKASNLKE